MLLPAQNRKDVKDLPQEVKDGLEILHVRYVNTFVPPVSFFGPAQRFFVMWLSAFA